ncbi:phosphate-starvation-inducible PsiE family protein [Acidocella facilis]|uniref:phosphate-starvation-inducible PsiE family protein n=1 Tax=Acidocella facilis TaxID=525 RepID=UPI00047B1EBD|nr:phosphate-starvation-inducible PsiE family protein [Acidocella facilis]
MSEPHHHKGANPFAREWSRLRQVFREASPYESFEHVIILVLTVLIMVITAVATVSLVQNVWGLVWQDQFSANSTSAFQDVFGNIFTVIIALEFKSSLRLTFVERKEVVRGRTIMLIALLAVARKFIILDLQATSPAELLALSAAALSLGAVYWLIREQDVRIFMRRSQPPGEATTPTKLG